MKKNYYILFTLFLFGISVFAQKTHFSQFYTTSMYLNPALAGIEVESKFTLNYRNQWPQIKNSFITQNASFETNLSKLNNGLGINVYRDQAGEGMMAINSYSMAYAHEVKLKRGLYMRFGLKGGFVQKTVEWDKLIFEDMIDARDGVVFNTQQEFGSSIFFADFSSGVLIYSEKYFGGFSINHLNQPHSGLLNRSGTARLPRAYALHAGAKYNFNGSNDYTLSPNMIISRQATFTKVNVGAYLEAKSLIVGLWYASNEAAVVIVGVNHNRFKIAYSYDIQTSKMIGSNLGSHEISYIQTFKKHNKKARKYRTSACPKF